MMHSERRKPAGIYTIAVTGGPSAGKTTLMKRISQEIPEAMCAPEVATILLSGGFPSPPQEQRQAWQESFQRAIAGTQLGLEEVIYNHAEIAGKKLIVYDRGLCDGMAYILSDDEARRPHDMRRFEAMTGESLATSLARYDLVLYLPTLVAHGTYEKASNNPHRFEEAEEALKLAEKTLYAWKDHPRRIVLDETDREARTKRGLKLIHELLLS